MFEKNNYTSECNCCFEKKEKYLRCNTYNCKYKMCEDCYYRWYVSHNICPHCRQEQLLLFDSHKFIINVYDGYYMRGIYHNTLLILLFLSLIFPVGLIFLLKFKLINFLNFYFLMIILLNPFKIFTFLYKLINNLIILFNNIINTIYLFFDSFIENI